MMKWPTTNKTSDKPDLSKLSDDALDDWMVAAGLMDQHELDRQRDMQLVNAVAKLPGGPHEYCNTLAGLLKLRDAGSFPLEAQDLYEKLRARAMADVKAAHRAAPQVTPSPAKVPTDKSVAGWLKMRWTSADEVVRHALQAVASAVGVSVPLSRTRESSVEGKDSRSTQRTESDLQPSQAEVCRKESPSEKEPEDNYDGPVWSDDAADGWTPCESLRDALHPEDRGWY